MKRVGGRIYELKRMLIIASIASLVFTTAPFYGGETYAASKPGAPKITSAKTTKDTLTVKFKKVKKAKKYQIAYKQAPNGKWSKANTKKNKYTIKRLIPGAKYSVKVRAYNGKWGKWSKAKTVVTKAETTFVNPNPQPTPQPNPQPTPQPVDESWTKYTEDGSSIEWRVDKDNTLHIRPISGDVGLIKNSSVDLYTEGDSFYGITREWNKLRGVKRVTVDKGTIRLDGDCKGFFSIFPDAINIDVSRFDTSNVTNMTCMFAFCGNLRSLDLSKFDTSKVKYMGGMFCNCSSLKSLDLSNFDTSNVVSMSYDFYGIQALDDDPWMGMFAYCTSLESLNIGNFDTGNVRYMRDMFRGCRKLKSLDLSNFDTSKVKDMGGMFCNCSSLESLDISNFDARNAYKEEMFDGCIKLNRVLFGDSFGFCGFIKSVIGYEENEAVNLLLGWTEFYDEEYRELILSGTAESFPSKLKINFFDPLGVTYSITDSDKAGYAKKLTASSGGETRVWYVKYEDITFHINEDDVIGYDADVYDEDETVNLLSDWDIKDVYDDDNKLLYREFVLKGIGESFPPNLKIDFVVPGVTYSITDSDKEGYAKKLTASYGSRTRVWYLKYNRDFDTIFKIDNVIGYDADVYDEDETDNLLLHWYEDDVRDNENNELLYRELHLEGTGENIPPNLKIDFTYSGVTYSITDSDKAGYEKKLTASYGGESRVWYLKYNWDFDTIFEIDDVIGYDADETNNLLSNWYKDDVYDENDELWYEKLILEGPGEDLPRNLKIKFAFPGVTYSITDSDKAGYVKKLTANYGDGTRVWYVKYKRDPDAIFKISDVIGYDADETNNLLSNWYKDDVYDENDELWYEELILEGPGEDLPRNLKIKFAFPGVTYSIADSDKAGYAKKLTASYGGETRVWYVRYEQDIDAIFDISNVIGYDEDETVNLLSGWYPDSELGINGLFLYGTGDNIPPNLKIKFAFPGVTYSIEDSDKANFEKKLTASYGGETKVWYMKYFGI